MKKSKNNMALLKIALISVVLCSLGSLAGCNSTKGKNTFAFPSMPKIKTKEAKPQKSNKGPLTVGEFIAGDRPEMF